MKTLKTILCTVLLSAVVLSPTWGQRKIDTKKSWFDSEKTLEHPWTVALGTGVGFSSNEENDKASYFEREDKPIGNSWRAELRYKLGLVQFGMEYLANYNSFEDDRLLTQYIAPTITIPYLYSNNQQAIYLQGSMGILNYQQSIQGSVPVEGNPMARDAKKINFSKNYFGVGFALGYQTTLYKRWALDSKLEVIIGDAGNASHKDSEEYSYMLEGTMTYLHLTFALQLGW